MASEQHRPQQGRGAGSALAPEALAQGVVAGDRGALGRAITLIESSRQDHRVAADELLGLLSGSDAGQASVRVAITGTPGVGKSTLIDALGMYLVEQGAKVAVLAVDPSSSVTGGSILGDRTRMARLSGAEGAFIRPSPTSGALGGVGGYTREAIEIVEAAGFDHVIVETVGVGQSEVSVAEMVDSYVVLMLANSGDELQGIKKGVLELADVIVINKADDPESTEVLAAAGEYKAALAMLGRGPDAAEGAWPVPVLAASGLRGEGVPELWQAVTDHREFREVTGELADRRSAQRVSAMWGVVASRLTAEAKHSPELSVLRDELEAAVAAGETPPQRAATQLIEAFLAQPGQGEVN